MKYFRSPETGQVLAYESDGSQDSYIDPALVPMTADEVAQYLAPPPVDVAVIIAARRWQAEVAGIEVAGMQVDTDDRSKLLINGAAVEAMLDPEYTLRWKTTDGFVELSAEQVISIARAVRAHVQACFDREAELLDALAEGTFTEAMLEEGWPDGSVPVPAAG